MDPIKDVIKSDFDIKCKISKEGWELSYKIPFYFLEQLFGEDTKIMHENFYKCGRYYKGSRIKYNAHMDFLSVP